MDDRCKCAVFQCDKDNIQPVAGLREPSMYHALRFIRHRNAGKGLIKGQTIVLILRIKEEATLFQASATFSSTTSLSGSNAT